MKKEKFLNWLFILSVLVSGLSFASCSDDDNDSNDDITPPVVDVPNPAGDDFYMFVNGDWHESLTDLKESQGYDVDMNNVLEEYTDDACEQLEEYQMVMQSLENLEADTSDLNLIRMVLFTNSIISEIETVEDAYIAIGKCIGMGLMQKFVIHSVLYFLKWVRVKMPIFTKEYVPENIQNTFLKPEAVRIL